MAYFDNPEDLPKVITNQIMEDQILLEWYLKGFKDELNGSSSVMDEDPLHKKAYHIGSNHAFIGDNVRSVDYLSNKEILNIIYGR